MSAGFDYHQLMDQCQALLIIALKDMGHDQDIIWQNKKINLVSPWERITVADAFLKYAPVTLEEALVQDKFDEIMVEYIEPRLGLERPTFIYDYPAKLAALAKIKKVIQLLQNDSNSTLADWNWPTAFRN